MHRILFVCAGFGGGIGKMIKFVSGAVTDIFNEVYLLHRGKESVNDIAPQGVIELELPYTNKKTWFWRLKEVWSIRKTMLQCNPDIVCCFGSEMSVMVFMSMIGITGSKLVLCDRGDPYTLPRSWKYLSRIAFNAADYCVFQLEKQSQWYGKRIMRKSTVIPNAFIPTGHIISYTGERKKNIVSVGRFVPEKRYEVLIEAFSKINCIHPDYQLILYGEGPYRHVYEGLCKQYGVQDSVKMPGYATDPMKEICDASVFVLSSLYEGMPNALIEALAIGIPTVSTDCTPGGPDFLTDHGYRGLIVPVNDVDAMFKSICQIIEDPQLAKELSERGPEIISILNKDKIASMWENFFQQIINNYA